MEGLERLEHRHANHESIASLYKFVCEDFGS